MQILVSVAVVSGCVDLCILLTFDLIRLLGGVHLSTALVCLHGYANLSPCLNLIG